MEKLNVVLGDMAYFNRYSINNYYVPLGAGYVATYLKQLFGKDINISIFRDPVQLIDYAKDNHVNIFGFSLYNWNTSLDKAVVKKIRRLYGDSVPIILGGPSIDVDAQEQKRMFEEFPDVNAIIENEGELGFANIVYKFLSDRSRLWEEAVDGVSFLKQGELIRGKAIGLTLNLEKLGSPYLNGSMDPFVSREFRPLLQTSRGCPYTCSFCVAGKNRCTLRKFPLAQVKEEMLFLSKKYSDRPHFTFYIADDNFGIFPRDIDVAEYLKKCSVELGYPQHVFFYSDKKFNATSKKIIEVLGDINQIGLAIALQSDNPTTLKAVGRSNLSSQDISQAIAWASEKGVQITTEMIFGLPHETLGSFVELLESSAKKGFDSIICHNLFLMNGIELNRRPMRDTYGLQTRYRLVSTNYCKIEDEFCVESEEVVVASTSFSFDDFLTLRNLNFIFYAIYGMSFYKWFFNALIRLNIPFVDFLYRFMNPDRSQKWPEGYTRFIDDLKEAFLGELYPTKDELKKSLLKIYEAHNDVAAPSRQNIYFGARLIYIEKWIPEVLSLHLKRFDIDAAQADVLKEALIICENERIDLNHIEENKSLTVHYDFISWRKEKYLTSIQSKKMPPTRLLLAIRPSVTQEIVSFMKECKHLDALDLYYTAIDALVPRTKLLYDLDYAREVM